MTLSHHQGRDKCRSNVSSFKKPDTSVQTLLKREGTFLAKFRCAMARHRAPRLGVRLTGAGCGVRRSRTMLLKGGCGYEKP